MSTSEDSGGDASSNPPFAVDLVRDQSIELDRAYDDRSNPSTLTVFPAEAEWPEIGTTWISVDVDHAVSITDSR